MKLHHLSVDDVFASLKTGPDGLSAREATRRLDEYGANVLEQVHRQPWLRRFGRGFTHLLAIILWLGAAIAFLAEHLEPGQGMATLGAAILGVVLINGIFSYWQEYRAEQALRSLEKLLPRETSLIRETRILRVPVAELTPGDLILVEEGDLVPADCRLVESTGLRVSNATITGESMPIAKDAEADTAENFEDSRNVVLAGTSVVSGHGRALVFAIGGKTVFGRIARLSQAAPEPLSPLQLEIHRLSRLIAFIALGLGLFFFGIGQLIGLSFWRNFIFAVGIIVANVPEGLLPTVTLSLAMASRRMARRKALIRHLPAVETLGCTTVVCTDKTGTLTQNRMEVRQVFANGNFLEASAFSSMPLPREIRRVALWCHDLTKNDDGPWTGDPMEIALRMFAETSSHSREKGVDRADRVGELAFDAHRKRLTVLCEFPNGRFALTKGAPETVLPLCGSLQTKEGVQPLCAETRREVAEAEVRLAEGGLRVLAFAYRAVRPDEADDVSSWERDLTFAGLIALWDPPRPEVADAVQKCHGAGIKVIMITGDHPGTACAIAREIGLAKQAVAITGAGLQRMSDTQLQLALDAEEILFARVSADQKLRIVAALKRKGHTVAVTGDGVNDAPALRYADVGIAMGRSGTDVARESADMVLLDDHFATIVNAIEEGRAVFANIRKFLTYILSSNVPEIVPYLAFVLFRIPLPLTVVQILAVDLGTDIVPALGLGSEKPSADVIRQSPRDRNEPLLTAAVLLRSYAFLGVLEALAAMAAFFFVLRGAGWAYGSPLSLSDPVYLQATTACFSAIVFMQVVNVFVCRDRRASAFAVSLFSNRLILLGIVVEWFMLALIVYSPWGNAVFQTAPLPVEVWLFILPFALLMLTLEEARKALVRHGSRSKTPLSSGR